MLDRKSCDLFKLVHEKPEMKTMVDTVEEAEHARLEQNCKIGYKGNMQLFLEFPRMANLEIWR